MATSAANSTDLHDWRRMGELFLQAFLAWFLPWLIAFIPQLNLGSFAPLGMIAVLLLTEAGKRYVQAPAPTPAQ